MKQKKTRKLLTGLLLVLALLAGTLTGCGQTHNHTDPVPKQTQQTAVTEDGEYTARDQVALYLHTYGHLPSNYITKEEARALGWVSSKGNLWDVAPGKSIGGDSFGNREGKLPEEKGLRYYECDINFDGSFRGGERLIYSNRGQIYYTGDHYNTFTLLYDKE